MGLFPRADRGDCTSRLVLGCSSGESLPSDDHDGSGLDSDKTCIIQQYIDSVGFFPRDDVELGSVLTPSANFTFLPDSVKYEDIGFHIIFKQKLTVKNQSSDSTNEPC